MTLYDEVVIYLCAVGLIGFIMFAAFFYIVNK
jgi:hypothetical protein